MRSRLSWFLPLLLVVALAAGSVACGPAAKFEISALTVIPPRVATGQSAAVEVSVANSGGGSGTYTVVFKIDDKTVETTEISVGPGEKKPVSFRYVAQAPGRYRVDLNGLAGTIEVVRPAEFKAASLAVSPERVVAGETITVTAEIKNTGEMEGAYNARLTVDGTVVATKDISLGAGASEKLTFTLSLEAGFHSMVLNGLSQAVNALRPAQFQVGSLSVSPAEVLAGKPVTVSTEIKNTGEVQGTYSARLTVDGKVVGTKDISLGAGATEKVSFTTPLEAGPHSLEVGGVIKALTALKPAELKVRSVKVAPAVVFSGQTATVEADITNAGEIKGTFPVAVTVNGVETDSRSVALDAGASSKEAFTVIRDLAGRYDIAVGGAKAALNVAEAETYNNPRFYYSISYPQEWTLNEDNPSLVRMGKTGAEVEVTVNQMSVATSLEEFARLYHDGTATKVQDWKVLSQSEVRKDGVVVSYRYQYSYTVDGTKIRAASLLMKKGRYAFAAWGEAQESLWDLNQPLFDASLESFQPPVVAVGPYTNSVEGFSLTLPGGWDCVETGERTPLLVIMNPAGQPVIIGQLYVERMSESVTSKYYALGVADGLKTAEGYQILSQGDITLGGGATGYQVLLTYTSQGSPLKVAVVSVVRGTQVFTQTVAALASTYDSAQSTIGQLLRSFTLVEPKPFGVSRQDSLFYWKGEIVTLDPALSEDAPDGLIGAIFSGLVKHDKDLKVAPDIAEKWEVSADGKTYTFHLRDGVKFHSGKAVTAADFKYSWERALDPRLKSRKASTYLGDIVGAKDILDGKATELAGVKLIDDRTLQVTIDGPKPYFLGKLVYVTAYVVDRANVARGKNWTDEPNGTGPFKLKQWKKNELLVLERNDSYYLGAAKLKNVVFQIFAGIPMMMYERGEIDVTGVGLNDLERVLDPSDPLNKELLSTKAMDIGYLGFNVTMPPFDDPRVRRAFALAVDMSKIIEVSLKGVAQPSGGFVPQGIPGYNSELKPLPFDPAQAKQLIAESKYGSADRLPPVTLYVLYGAGPADEAMVAMWRQNLGVEVKVEAIRELKEWFERRHNREFQLFVGGWGADYIDPQNFLEVLFHSQSQENGFAYSNPEVDAALKEAAVERDEAKRLKKYQEIEKLVLKDLPAVPFYQSEKLRMLVKPYVKGLNLYPMSVNHWSQASVTPH